MIFKKTALAAYFAISFFFVKVTAQQFNITGQLVGESDKKPIEFASIALLNVNDSTLLKGAVSDEKGFFAITNISMGSYLLRYSFVGYETKYSNKLNLNASINLGRITLNSAGKTLNEFTIKEEKNLIQINPDKKVYNVSKDLNNTGGTATDVLSNLPSVTVDADRNVSFRGNADVRILIDGKPSNLSGSGSVLDQIPAESIERIEVISNPSSKYDAEGSTGIINIITKKGNKKMSNGNVVLNAGTGDKYQANINLNKGFGRSALSFSYGWQQNNQWGAGNSNRKTFFEAPVGNLQQEESSYRKKYNHNIRIGYDIELKHNSSLSFSMGVNTQNETDRGSVFYSFLNNSFSPDSLGIRNNNLVNKNLNFEYYAGWKKNFKKHNASINAEATLSTGRKDDFLSATQIYQAAFYETSRLPDIQEITNPMPSYVMNLQTDYNQTIFGNHKLEAGAKLIARKIDTKFESRIAQGFNYTLLIDTGLSNHFVYEEEVSSAYFNLSGAKKKFSYGGGLRVELTNYQANQVTSNDNKGNFYLNLFPSAYVAYKLQKTKDLQMSYSRRITRPSTEQLNPFPQQEDPYNIRRGNAFLLPEFIDALEANFVSVMKKGLFSLTAYGRLRTGLISRYRAINDEGVTTTSFENLNNSLAYGVESIVQYELMKTWKVNGNMNIYQVSIDGNNLGSGIQRTNWGALLRVMNVFSLPKQSELQMTYNYMLPGWALMGTIRAFQNFDVAYKKDFLNRNLSVVFRVSDLFNTREFYIDMEGIGFQQSFLRKRESRIYNISLSYAFGKANGNGKKPKKIIPEGGMGDDF